MDPLELQVLDQTIAILQKWKEEGGSRQGDRNKLERCVAFLVNQAEQRLDVKEVP